MNGVKRNMKSNEIKQYTPLLIELLKRDIKVKYRKSVLGVLWSVLNPLFMMIILSVVFSTLFKNNVENYPTYIFSGQLIYNFFSEATTSSMSAIVDNASLIKKIYVPKYLFVLARICSSMINLMATLSALFCVMLVLRIDLSYRLYEGVVALILLTLFSTGVGLVLSAIAVKFRDMMHLYSVFLTALMYLCPIIYTIGLNGSGKSTILKIIAGILRPTQGTVKVKGKIAPLIELGAGFDGDLTGEENVYLNGALLGYSQSEMKKNYRDIVEFSELENFMNVPVKNYSSGMLSRLAFAIATIGIPDILIVDEVLSVGDFRFQKKCEDRIKKMQESGTTVLFVSHSIEQVKKICNKIVWLDHGKVRMYGNTREVCEEYEKI